jgi:hypothetical protein
MTPRVIARLVVCLLILAPSQASAFDSGGGFKIEDGIISGGPQVDVVNYSGSSATYTTTWTKPSWATTVHIWCVGGGGGGQGGNKGTLSLTNTSTGGASASPSEGWFRASDLPSTVTVVIGKGATGGNGATADNGTGGSPGGRNDSRAGPSGCVPQAAISSQTSCLVYSYGANASALTWAGVAGGTPMQSGSQHQTCLGLAANAPGAGGGGGGIITSTATDGYGGSDGCRSPGSGGSGGTVAGTRAGSPGTSYTSGRRVGGGGGGGAASMTAGVTGGTGGAGGSPGGGGGGGGGGLNTTSNGGAGGAGGNGACVFITY